MNQTEEKREEWEVEMQAHGQQCSLPTFRSKSSKLSSALLPPSHTFVALCPAGRQREEREMLKLPTRTRRRRVIGED